VLYVKKKGYLCVLLRCFQNKFLQVQEVSLSICQKHLPIGTLKKLLFDCKINKASLGRAYFQRCRKAFSVRIGKQASACVGGVPCAPTAAADGEQNTPVCAALQILGVRRHSLTVLTGASPSSLLARGSMCAAR
jgi:hypothetical protein